MTSWFRSWHGAPTDPKWLLIARKADVSPAIVSAIVWALFDYASQHQDRGSVEGFDEETYAVWAGISEEEIRAVIVALTDKGVIVDDRLTAWEKRQPKREDDSKERVRAHRERKAAETPSNKEDVTPRNADVTHGNAPEKIQRREDTEGKGTIAAARRERTPDLLFEAVAEAWKGIPYPELKLTKSQRGNVAQAVAQLRAIDADPSDVPREWDCLRSRFDNPTPAALAKHWGTHGTGPKNGRSSLDVVENYIAGIGRSGAGGNHRHGVDVVREAPQRERPQGLDSGLLELPDRGAGGDA